MPGNNVAILGGGNVGQAMALGWLRSGRFAAHEITVTRRHPDKLIELEKQGLRTGADNLHAIQAARIVVLAVQPQQIDDLAGEIRSGLVPDRHLVVSVVSGISIRRLATMLERPVPIVRAMPNTAISIGRSMTCLAAADGASPALDECVELFNALGETLCISEEMMVPATALCACGLAFFLRSVRAASQGGIEIGFHPEEALKIAAQTALGAASLLLNSRSHPEAEIDRVTTPRGCTIAGLNEMEHRGFSSAMIKGIITSAREASALLSKDIDAPDPGKRRRDW
ncbi:pyrroline-5-carboxylate reductase [soil metagenome]